MDSIYGEGKFPFTYDGISDPNPNPGHDIEEFRPGRYFTIFIIFPVGQAN